MIEFTYVFQTGTVAPPYYYTCEITGKVVGQQATVRYKLAYPHQATSNVEWAGSLDEALAKQLKALIASTTMQKENEATHHNRLGGSSVKLTIRESEHGNVEGKPMNRDAWQKFEREIGVLARRGQGPSK